MGAVPTGNKLPAILNAVNQCINIKMFISSDAYNHVEQVTRAIATLLFFSKIQLMLENTKTWIH